MSNKTELNHKMEEMRAQLNALVAEKNFNMKDPDIIVLSNALDRLIVKIEKIKRQDKGEESS